MQISIPRRLLAAVSRAMAEKDVRYYLHGLLVEVAGFEVRLVATNGHIAAAARFTIDTASMLSAIMPYAAIKHAIATKADTVVLELDSSCKYSLAGLAFSPVEGKFPDYRRIFPSRVTGAAAPGFAPEYIAAFAKAGKDLGSRNGPILRQNGSSGTVVHFYNIDDFVGVLMPQNPFTAKFPDAGFPTWAGM